ncbi:DUF6522 family protein [Methylonatrum kenyense]|uniref:DUF6522 family protein n=1 Tax=Methylonatrum kenyense TaxID=455253 RepID=UPI0020C09FA0|nr:DUF6522 family protein [Methylonatrum kenyense]MCK8515079.1 DUF6522 family protein [Methylonatrum kenyense]
MRALPASVFSGFPNEITVDASFVAERLGFSENELRQAMRTGRVTATVEHGVADDDGRARVSFRAGTKLWSGVIEPDGSAYELETDLVLDRVPRHSPRPGLRRETRLSETALTLNRMRLLVRSILLQHVGETGYVSESELQDQLATVMSAVEPKLPRRALAILMHEDQRAGRPFLASLVKADSEEGPWEGFMEAARRCRPGGKRCPTGDDGGAFWRAEAEKAREFYGLVGETAGAVRSYRPRHSRGQYAATSRRGASMDNQGQQ